MGIDDALDGVARDLNRLVTPKGSDCYWWHREFSRILKRHGLRLVWIDTNAGIELRLKENLPSWVIWLLRQLKVIGY